MSLDVYGPGDELPNDPPPDELPDFPAGEEVPPAPPRIFEADDDVGRVLEGEDLGAPPAEEVLSVAAAELELSRASAALATTKARDDHAEREAQRAELALAAAKRGLGDPAVAPAKAEKAWRDARSARELAADRRAATAEARRADEEVYAGAKNVYGLARDAERERERWGCRDRIVALVLAGLALDAHDPERRRYLDAAHVQLLNAPFAEEFDPDLEQARRDAGTRLSSLVPIPVLPSLAAFVDEIVNPQIFTNRPATPKEPNRAS